jgi:hypothetical protein
MPIEPTYIQYYRDKALKSSWDFLNKYYDPPAFTQLLDWKTQSQRSIDLGLGLVDLEAALPYILKVEQWKDSIMYEYIMVKKVAIEAGLPVDMSYDHLGPPPYTFTEIFLIINSSYRPSGWVMPSI